MARRVHYVLSTHWDREWYQSFQDYRARLVQLLDRVLDGLASGVLAGPFTCDGQAIILEDYLEIRPERRAQIAEFVAAGRLVVGPWYVLPDEFLVSGEALVRNLRLGREVARQFGGTPSSAGFACDLFGHHSQLPQILAGCGIGFAIVWRGLNSIEHRNLLWRGADGTTLPVLRFGCHGYCSYDFFVRHANDHRHQPSREATLADLDRWLAAEAAATVVDPILMFDGGDHLEWNEANYAILRERFGQHGDFEIVHSSLDAYGCELLAQRDRIAAEVSGELREPASLPSDQDNQWLIPGVLASRVWIKQQNAACQDLLCLWAEPLAAVASSALGDPAPDGYLQVAWRWLLQNHPHDSICGCSIDQVHDDMVYRFSQCRQIGEGVADRAAHRLTAAVAGDLADGELRVGVFNPLPQAVDRVVELELPIPAEWPSFQEFFGFEAKPGFRIYGPDGAELPYQRLAQRPQVTHKRLPPRCFPGTYRCHHVTVALRLPIPALGYTTLTVRRAGPGEPTRYPTTPAQASSERGCSNGLLSLTIQPNGAVDLLDQRTGRRYERLLTFESVADIGDGWYHGQAVNDQVQVSSGAHAELALVADGPLQTTFLVRTHLRLATDFDFGRMTRNQQTVEQVIESRLTLRAGCDWLEVETRLVNQAADQRLRVLNPSGCRKAATWWADSPFDALERPIALRADNHTYRELEVETKPQQSWSAVCDASGGLAVVTTGLLETAVRDLPERPLALTLLRSTRRTVMTDGEPGGLLLGKELVFRYRLVPLSGPPDPVQLGRLAQDLAAGLRSVALQPADLAIERPTAAVPAAAGRLAVTGEVLVSSVRDVAGGLEVRLFNPTARPTVARLSFDAALGALPVQATQVDLESTPLADLPCPGGGCQVAVAPKQLTTIRFT
ncbi:MAG: hypothetical protein IT204_24590 [Fimbriimonadaceae bacterium]|nr:hypothetical protein [Fimbriimonadaceae bacterium]